MGLTVSIVLIPKFCFENTGMRDKLEAALSEIFDVVPFQKSIIGSLASKNTGNSENYWYVASSLTALSPPEPDNRFYGARTSLVDGVGKWLLEHAVSGVGDNGSETGKAVLFLSVNLEAGKT